MRLKPEKIEDLAQKVVHELKEHSEIAFRSDEDAIFHEIRTVIENDIVREDKLEEEARKLLDQHMNRIRRKNVNYANLVRKAKQQLAKDRGLKL